MVQVPGPFTLECFLCYSLTLFFFCTFLHSLSPTLKCCIQLAKPGKLPLVSVNQEKNSGTHILMITELGKKHCFPLHQYLFCSVVGVPSHHQLVFYFAGCNRKATPWHCFECVLFVALVGIDCLVLAFLNDFPPHGTREPLITPIWPGSCFQSIFALMHFLWPGPCGFFFLFHVSPCSPAFSLILLFQHTVSLTDMSSQLSEEVKGKI